MNAALAAFVQELRDTAPEECGHGPTLRKCCSAVSGAESPIDPQKVHLLAAFGEGFIAQRIRKHFASEESRSQLAQLPQSDLHAQVRCELDALLAGGQLAGRALTAPLQKAAQQTRDALEAFFSLQDVRDVQLLRGCSQQLASHLASHCQPGQKRAGGPDAGRAGGGSAGVGDDPPPGKRRCKTEAGEAGASGAGVADAAAGGARDAKKTDGTAGGGAYLGGPPSGKRCKTEAGEVRAGGARIAAAAGDGARDSRQAAGAAGATPSAIKAEDADSPPKLSRPCRPYTGEWAMMVALHLNGGPLSRSQMVETISKLQLCSKQLASQHGALSEAEENGGNERSACARLYSLGCMTSAGGHSYALTESGRVEAARYALQREALADKAACPLKPPIGAGIPAGGTEGAAADGKEDCEAQPKTGGKAKARGGRGRGRGRGQGRREEAGAGGEPADGEAEQQLSETSLRERPAAAAGSGASGSFSVLVDVREQPVIRAALGRLLASSAELQIPGIDYAFGRQVGQEWTVARVLLERKTVHDYQGTLASSHGAHQARIQASLRAEGFRVAVLLEGSGELSRHPQQDELLASIYAGAIDVLTTASVTDTAELLMGFAECAHERPGWGLARMQALLKPIYATDPSCTCTAALVASGISRQVAQRLTRAYGELHKLLAQLPSPEGDAEVVVAEVAKSAGLTLYQAGKALRALGLERAPLSRKRGPRALQAEKDEKPQSANQRWRRNTLGQASLSLSVKVGAGSHKEFARCLRKLLPQTEQVNSLAANTLQLRLGEHGPSHAFAVGDGSRLAPGWHWLLLPAAADWQKVARARAHAYACKGVVSSLCASPSQAARHVAACAAALKQSNSVNTASEATRQRAGGGLRAASGLAGVLGLARTAQGTLPAAVAENVARRSHCTGVCQLVLKLRQAGGKWLQALSVKDFGPERAAAVRALLLGS